MSKIIKTEKGFAVLELILIVLVLGVVGFTGWWVYVNQHKTVYAKNTITTYTKKATTKSTINEPSQSSSSITSNPSSSASVTPCTTTASSSGIFTIPEWGIKIINVPISISDLTCSISAVNSTVTHNAAGFSTSTLTNKDSACSNDEGGGSIGELDYYQGTNNSSATYGPIQFVKQFDGFWIAFSPNGIPCSQDSTTVDLQSSQADTFDSLVTNPSNLIVIP